MIARAAQEYGLIVRDQTHHAIGLYAEDPLPLGKNPYYTHGVPAPAGPFEGQWPYALLARFPWNRLQVLLTSLRSEWEPVRALIDTNDEDVRCASCEAVQRFESPRRRAVLRRRRSGLDDDRSISLPCFAYAR